MAEMKTERRHGFRGKLGRGAQAASGATRATRELILQVSDTDKTSETL